MMTWYLILSGHLILDWSMCRVRPRPAFCRSTIKTWSIWNRYSVPQMWRTFATWYALLASTIHLSIIHIARWSGPTNTGTGFLVDLLTSILRSSCCNCLKVCHVAYDYKLLFFSFDCINQKMIKTTTSFLKISWPFKDRAKLYQMFENYHCYEGVKFGHSEGRLSSESSRFLSFESSNYFSARLPNWFSR